MIDLITGAILGALGMYAYVHFRGENPAKAFSDLTTLETRIRSMITQAMQDALSALKTAMEADKAKAVADALAAHSPQPAIDAAVAEDVAAVNDLTAQITPPPAP